MKLLVFIVLIVQACATYAGTPAEPAPEPIGTVSGGGGVSISEIQQADEPAMEPAGAASEAESVSASETQPAEEPVMDSLRLNFGELQTALARRLFPRSALDLFSAPLPPLAVADGFGLLVDRNFGP